MVDDDEVARKLKQSAFCSRLESAVGDESSARKEYGMLEKAARNEGLENEADAINMISEQESSHEDFFRNLKRREC